MAHILNGLEHRWGERVRVDIPVRLLAHGRDAAHGHIKNLSLSGALLRSQQELVLPLLIEVHIEPAFQSGTACVVKARVSRMVTYGVGIEWCDFAPIVVKDLLRSPSLRLPL